MVLGTHMIGHYRDTVEQFYREEGIEYNGLSEFRVAIATMDESAGDGQYDGETDILAAQVAAEGRPHNFSEGIERGVEIIDDGIEPTLAHEATHRAFQQYFPGHVDDVSRLWERSEFEEAKNEAYEKFMETSPGFGGAPFENYVERTNQFRQNIVEGLEQRGAGELVDTFKQRFAMGGIDEHIARIAEKEYMGEDITSLEHRDAYVETLEFEYYVVARNDIINANIERLGQYVEKNSISDVLKMEPEELVDQFYDENL